MILIKKDSDLFPYTTFCELPNFFLWWGVHEDGVDTGGCPSISLPKEKKSTIKINHFFPDTCCAYIFSVIGRPFDFKSRALSLF